MSTIPTTFSPVNLTNKQLIESFTAQFSPYCDFSFTNLYIWNTDGRKTFFKFHDNTLVIKTYNLISQEPMYSLLGHNIDTHVVDALLNETDTIEFVPEECISPLLTKNIKYHITEDIDNHDYIIDLVQLKKLEGNGMKSVRQKLTRFKRDFNSCRIEQLNSSKDYMELMQLFHKWKLTRDQNQTKALDITECALIKLLEYKEAINLQILGVKSEENVLLGFVVNELTTSDTAIGLFGFADNKIKGIYQALEYATCLALVEKGYKYINLEQDLGIQNLRKAKQELQPYKLLKKYRIKRS